MTNDRDAYRIFGSMRALYKCKVNGKSKHKTSLIVERRKGAAPPCEQCHKILRTINSPRNHILNEALLMIHYERDETKTKTIPFNPHVFFHCHVIWETSEAFESNCQLVSSPNGWVRYPRWAFSGLITIIGGIRRIVSQGAKLALPLMIAVWALLINCGCREIWTRFFSSLAFQHCLHPASRNPSQISRWHHITLISD